MVRDSGFKLQTSNFQVTYYLRALRLTLQWYYSPGFISLTLQSHFLWVEFYQIAKMRLDFKSGLRTNSRMVGQFCDMERRSLSSVLSSTIALQTVTRYWLYAMAEFRSTPGWVREFWTHNSWWWHHRYDTSCSHFQCACWLCHGKNMKHETHRKPCSHTV